MIVASQAKIWMPLGIAIAMLAAAKNVIVSCGSPTANMWCTQTPKPRNPVAIVASATQRAARPSAAARRRG